jgi:hypothetical protein
VHIHIAGVSAYIAQYVIDVEEVVVFGKKDRSCPHFHYQKTCCSRRWGTKDNLSKRKWNGCKKLVFCDLEESTHL